MKTNIDQLQLADYGLTEMTAPEMKEANGGSIQGIIPGVWYAIWGSIYTALDILTPGSNFLKTLIQTIVGGVPSWDN